jgi:hypothetical protein
MTEHCQKQWPYLRNTSNFEKTESLTYGFGVLGPLWTARTTEGRIKPGFLSQSLRVIQCLGLIPDLLLDCIIEILVSD